MKVEEIKKIIKDHLAELLNIEPEKISDTDRIVDDLGADSIVVVQLYLSCQEEFDIVIADELDLYVSQSIQSLSEMVIEKMKEAEATIEEKEK